MRLPERETANARMLAHAPTVRPVTAGDITRTHRKKYQ
jgi:hypothetical protein